MDFICQHEAINQLEVLAKYKRQSIVIEGPRGCGKTYLAKEYGKMINVLDFQVLEPKVDIIRSGIEECLNLNEPIVLCIENLDKGVQSASYALLKFLEEPPAVVTILVTCQSLQMIPETIVSRSTVVTVNPPIDSDLVQYAEIKYGDQAKQIIGTDIWKSVRAFRDVELVMSFTPDKLNYYKSLTSVCKFNDSISNIIWKLGHYDDNTETPVEFVIRYIMNYLKNPFVERCGIECIRDLNLGRIAPHAVLAKFAFNAKYCE